ncbi:hypothetical protein BKA62DRAFT_707371 [Auriculariales sp. MPI-PUGE-AT-0066]|nr:hypothetical protein BKA62DRAFT_707371 [Auriculariales sp. MPI-PUGE-AT-0066]
MPAPRRTPYVARPDATRNSPPTPPSNLWSYERLDKPSRDLLRVADESDARVAAITMPPSLVTLGEDPLFVIYDFLEPEDIISLRQTCKALHALSHERIVWLRTLRRAMEASHVPEKQNFLQSSTLSANRAESLATRSLRLSRALTTIPDPTAAKIRSFDLLLPHGFLTRGISDVVHGRWIAVIGHTKPSTLEAAKGSLYIFDLGLGQAAGAGQPYAKLSIPFVGDALLVDFAPLPDSNSALLSYAYTPPQSPSESMYNIHVLNLAPNSFGIIPTFDFALMVPHIADVSMCRDTFALDLDCGLICLINWVKRTVGLTTCSQLQSRAGSRNKAIQLIPGAILLADTWNSRIFSLPLIALTDAVGQQTVLRVQARQLAQLPINEFAAQRDLSLTLKGALRPGPSVRFLRPPIAHEQEGGATLHLAYHTQHLIHFSTTPQVFGDPPCRTETLPLGDNPSILAVSHVRGHVVVISTDRRQMFGPTQLDVASMPSQNTHFEAAGKLKPTDAPFDLGVSHSIDSMDGIEHTHAILRPLVRRPVAWPHGMGFPQPESNWRILNGALNGPEAWPSVEMVIVPPLTKRTGVVVDEIGGRVVLLEGRIDGSVGTRVRILEYE